MTGYDIEYTDGNTGEKKSHRFTGNKMGAEGWVKTLQAENGGKATLFNRSHGTTPRKEVSSRGDSSDRPTRRPPFGNMKTKRF